MAGNLKNSKFFKGIHNFLVFLMILPIRMYKLLISPFLGKSCRFYPSCSEYAVEAFKSRGIITGFFLTIWRIIRCNPWGGHGYDPVPPPRKKISLKDHFQKISDNILILNKKK